MSSTIDILRQHFIPTLAMLESTITRCPDSLWYGNNAHESIWKRLLHTLESLDYFLNDFGEYRFASIKKQVSAEYDANDTDTLNRQELRTYFVSVRKKLEGAFTDLSDSKLHDKSHTIPHYSLLALFLVQLRHLSLNTGRCGETLRTKAGIEIEWLGYIEPADGQSQ